MLNWLKNASDAAAFRFAWMKRKSDEKKQRWAELLEQYPVEAIEKAALELEHEITERVRSKYNKRKKFYDDEIGLIVVRQSELTRIRRVLTRDYEQELHACYERKEQIKRQHASLKLELPNAYQQLADAKADIDAWHQKSKRSGLVFGNSRKKIPKHSLFGQSFSDLDATKARRDKAAGDIRELKCEKERLSAEFNQLDKKIQEIREGQREHRELVARGYTYTSVEAENSQLSKKFSQFTLRSKATKRRSERVLKQELALSSASQKRQVAADMRERRKSEWASFLADDQVQQRRASFLSDWKRARANVA